MQQEEWFSITPTLEWDSSPVIERTVDQWNAEYEQAQAPQNMEELDTLVQDLRDNPPTPTVTLAPPADIATEKQNPAAPNVDKELPTPASPTPAVFMETVAVMPRQPLLLARREPLQCLQLPPLPLSVPDQNLGGGKERDSLPREHLPCLLCRRSNALRQGWTPSFHSSPSSGSLETSYGSWDILSSGGKLSLL